MISIRLRHATDLGARLVTDWVPGEVLVRGGVTLDN
jgi:hypothetical protein